MQFRGPTPAFNPVKQGIPVGRQPSPLPMTAPVGIPVSRPGVIGQPGVSPVKIPTNLNYPIGQGRFPQANNNAIPPQIPVIGMGQQPFIPPNTPQFLPMQYLGHSMGPQPLPAGNFIGNNLGMQIGSPYGMIPARPSYVGYRKLNDSNLINPNMNKPKIDTTIEQEPIYCIICQTQYLAKDKQQHIKRHQRKSQNNQTIKKLRQYKQQYTGFHTRPIVEPEEYNIQYNPNSFIVEQETNFRTEKVQPIPEIPRRQFAIGTSDFNENNNNTTSNVASNVATTSPTTQQKSIAFQPEIVRLTDDGEEVIYVDPNRYQGNRIFRETQINQPPVITNNTNSDSRFTRNTFISDQPAPIVQPNSGLYGRETIQSQQFRGSQYSRVGNSQKPPQYAAMTPNPNQIPVSNTLPPRDTVMSQDYRSSQTIPFNTNSQNLGVSQKIATNHQSVMSPIREQSENRNTVSQQNEDYMAEQQRQQSTFRMTQSRVNDNSNVYQQNQARSTANPVIPDSSTFEKENLPVIGSMSNQQIPTQKSILDTFDYGNAGTNVIPRQSRKIIQFDPNTNNITNINTNPAHLDVNNQDIPISMIIQDKFGK